jgi:hypothetical protein
LKDSKNDNPAFKRGDISIGVRSDKRLNPKLTCQYLVEFNQPPIFLKKLQDNDFVFSDNSSLTFKLRKKIQLLSTAKRQIIDD